MTVLIWTGIIAGAVVAAGMLLAAGAWVMLAVGNWRWKRRRVKTRTRPHQVVPYPLPGVPGEVTDPVLREYLLLHACGPCSGIRHTRVCVCPASCGSPRCQGIHDSDRDLSGALLRITREADRG